MPLSKPLPVLAPGRVRQVPPSFAWIDHRLRSDGILDRLQPEDMGLYLFLALAADREGLSCWRLDRIQRTIPCFDRHALWNARKRLCAHDLIAYRPWRPGDADGSYQVLSVQTPKDTLPPELRQMMESVFRRMEPEPPRP